MTRTLPTLATAILLTLTGCGGDNTTAQPSPSPTPPSTSTTPASPTAPAGPASVGDRKAACRKAFTLSGDAAELITKAAKQQPINLDKVRTLIRDIRRAATPLPPNVADTYQELIKPMSDLAEALQYGGTFTASGDDFRANGLAFAQSCLEWAEAGS